MSDHYKQQSRTSLEFCRMEVQQLPCWTLCSLTWLCTASHTDHQDFFQVKRPCRWSIILSLVLGFWQTALLLQWVFNGVRRIFCQLVNGSWVQGILCQGSTAIVPGDHLTLFHPLSCGLIPKCQCFLLMIHEGVSQPGHSLPMAQPPAPGYCRINEFQLHWWSGQTNNMSLNLEFNL